MGPFSRPSSERVSGPEKGKRKEITRKADAFGEFGVLANITLYHSILHYIIDYNTYIYIYMYMLTLLVTHFSSPISGPPKEGRPRPALELEARARLQSVSIISIFKFSI